MHCTASIACHPSPPNPKDTPPLTRQQPSVSSCSPFEYSRLGFRQQVAREEPASIGMERLSARCIIHSASSMQYEKCLSVYLPALRNDQQTAAKRPGKTEWSPARVQSFRGVSVCVVDGRPSAPSEQWGKTARQNRGCGRRRAFKASEEWGVHRHAFPCVREDPCDLLEEVSLRVERTAELVLGVVTVPAQRMPPSAQDSADRAAVKVSASGVGRFRWEGRMAV